ncbi:conjugal transfer protein TrbI [Metarhizobium album]|uniref:Conjugal transfer protein TrbI n=1 Tax=Metarhizobium album TaxID=2182425 RepID=A0A2U2DK40_9HYPH|nr:type IV secretion system protein VirB10 [Rhizobium album]PWE53686.1 conjugal transfer protein TrbI [Rhizobium album]
MKRSPELDAMLAADDTDIRDRRARRSQLLGGAALLLGGAALAYLVVFAPQRQAKDALQGDEEFTTTTFRPPSFLRDTPQVEEKPKTEVIEIPTPPESKPEEKSDTTQFDVPPPPIAVETAEKTEKSVEEFPKRFLSKQVVVDATTPEAGNGAASGNPDSGATVAGEDRASKYLAAASALGDRSAKARQIGRIDAMIPEGTLIPGILETAINSDLPGQIRAITSQDVYSFDGRRVLVPTGTRLIGEYQSDVTRGQKRIFVIWTRLLRDDGVTVRLNSIGTDSLGRSGLTGIVDNKWRERFGSAILLSIVGGGASYLTGYGSDQYSSSGSSGGNNGSSNSDRAADLARQTIAQTFSDMANQALSENLKIPPTISVHQGERIFVYVRQDLDFSAMYPDPVEEALKEIKHERGLDTGRFQQ